MNENLETYYKDLNNGLQGLFKEATGESSEEVESEPKEWFDFEFRYEEKGSIAQGGVKEIFRAEDMKVGRSVAIARLRQDIEKSNDNIDRFLHEARMTVALAHPNIMPVYDMGMDDAGEPFFVMKLMKGNDLNKVMRELRKNNPVYRQNYPLSALLEIFTKICEAVSYAHSNGVIHLDLKPDNIYIGGFGEVFVCDWGLSKMIDAPEKGISSSLNIDQTLFNSITLSGMIKGTPGFMAPEQVNLKFAEKTEKTDIFSLGCLLYTLVTYTEPFVGGTVEERLIRTVKGVYVPPRKTSFGKEVPESLAAVCRKAMANRPEERYSSVKELLKDIRAYQNGFATAAENANFMKAFLLLLKRHKAVSALLFVFIFIMIGGGIKIKQNELAAKESEKVARESEEKARRSALLASQKELAAKESAELAKLKEQEAKNSLALLEKAIKQRNSHAEKLYPVWEEKLRADFKYMKPEDVVALIESMLQVEPEAPECHRYLAVNYFVNQEFKKCREILEEKKTGSWSDILEMCEEIREKYGEKQRLSQSFAVELIERMNNRKREFLPVQFAAGYYKKLGTLKDKADFITEILKLDHKKRPLPELKTNITLREDGEEVSFEGAEALRNIRMLGLMPFVSLNLDNTDVDNLNWLRNHQLVEISARNTKVRSVKGLLEARSLKRLILPKIAVNPPLTAAKKLEEKGVAVSYED